MIFFLFFLKCMCTTHIKLLEGNVCLYCTGTLFWLLNFPHYHSLKFVVLICCSTYYVFQAFAGNPLKDTHAHSTPRFPPSSSVNSHWQSLKHWAIFSLFASSISFIIAFSAKSSFMPACPTHFPFDIGFPFFLLTCVCTHAFGNDVPTAFSLCLHHPLAPVAFLS